MANSVESQIKHNLTRKS